MPISATKHVKRRKWREQTCIIPSKKSLSLLTVPITNLFLHLQEMSNFLSDIVVVAIDTSIPLDEHIENPLTIAMTLQKQVIVVMMNTNSEISADDSSNSDYTYEITEQLTSNGIPQEHIIHINQQTEGGETNPRS